MRTHRRAMSGSSRRDRPAHTGAERRPTNRHFGGTRFVEATERVGSVLDDSPKKATSLPTRSAYRLVLSRPVHGGVLVLFRLFSYPIQRRWERPVAAHLGVDSGLSIC